MAALLLCVAGVGKLRAPEGARGALQALGLRVPKAAVRVLACAEVALGAVAVVFPSRVWCAACGGLYALFCGVSILLARRRVSCGCFGESEVPASPVQAWLSAALALVSVAASIWPAPSPGWLFGHDPLLVATMVVGLAGAVYATAIAYLELPAAWQAWSGR